MIFGLSHLTYCSKNITKDLKYFEQFNYKEFFRENVYNHKLKSRFLSSYKKNHKIHFLKSYSNGPNLELIDYSNKNEKKSNSFKLLNYNTLQLYSRNSNKDADFLTKLIGFKKNGKNYSFKRSISSWNINIQIEDSNYKKENLIDDIGFVTVSFLCKNINKLENKLNDFSCYDIIPNYKLSVNKRKLKILIFKLPGGSFCELIENIK